MATTIRAQAKPVQRPAASTGAVSKGYSFASTWEQNAPLTEDQHAAITALSQVVAERPMPPHLANQPAGGRELDSTISSLDSSDQITMMTDAVLLNSHQFYKWYSDLESSMKSETEEKYRHYENTLTGYLETCDGIFGQVDSTLGLFDDLQAQHRAVEIKTKTLHDACERLVMEKDRLVEFADALRSKLNYFDELENIAAQFYSPTMNVGSGHFLPLLKRLDECISYVSNNPQYADSSVYLVKFKQLQSRALGMLRMHIVSILKNASTQLALKESSGVNGKMLLAEGAETSVLYVRFKAAASELKALMEEIESRSSRKEYAQLLTDCHSLYCEQRLHLVQGVVQQRVLDYAKKELLASLTRAGCAYLMQVCQQEHQLFYHFFPSSSSESSNLAPLLDPLCISLYDTLRPKYIYEADLDLLCELVEILKVEVLDEQLSRRGESVGGLRPTILRTLADVQERLTFRAQTFMRDEIANYLPIADDIDYPNKLEQATTTSEAEITDQDVQTSIPLYPPLDKTISCLLKLYRCLEPTIFMGIAQEAVALCSSSIQRASKLITRRASQMDGQLFLIKHFLILREQIAPFDINFAVTYKELDFAHLLEHLRRILRGQASIFDYTTRSSLVRTFSPRVLENQVDAKKELEKNLKTTCEQFIMYVTKLVVEPMLSFVTKVTAVRVSLSTMGKGTTSDSNMSRSLKEQAFATPEKVAEMASKVDNALMHELPGVVSKMKLYLQNPSTQSILFKPIKSNIIEAYGQVFSLVAVEYSKEDATSINLKEPANLQNYLDSLCS
ncbi:hypothetical protein O6H91_04G039200 [Diphasiastrum complanatum]|uniref:Uncharacterized protein n=1 Tax=Diphasiastrum complanatum TaxID=34168 RepID=A0ACC2DW02_DIPCM|nr:hypothetical protein O6H91_04G039200 [Diphasiastrum complanatum]